MAGSQRKLQLLKNEVTIIQAWLDRFDEPYPRGVRRARAHEEGDYVVVENLPLPDGYHPDYLDVVLLTDQFPDRPPIGLYMLNRGNQALTSQIARRQNVFMNRAYHA